MKAAAIYCSERGGKLFEPKSENVYNEVSSTLTEKHGFQDWSFWIGIHDISTEGHFVYNSDNSPGLLIFIWLFTCSKIYIYYHSCLDQLGKWTTQWLWRW